MNICVDVCISKIIYLIINLGIYVYMTYANCQTLTIYNIYIYRSPVTFKMKLYITTLNNSFQSLPFLSQRASFLDVAWGLN